MKQEPETQSMPVIPPNNNTNFLPNTNLFPILNANNSNILPLVPQPMNKKTQIITNCQILLLKKYLENVRIAQEIRLLYGELLKGQQVFNSLNMNWEVLRLISNNATGMNN